MSGTWSFLSPASASTGSPSPAGASYALKHRYEGMGYPVETDLTHSSSSAAGLFTRVLTG